MDRQMKESIGSTKEYSYVPTRKIPTRIKKICKVRIGLVKTKELAL